MFKRFLAGACLALALPSLAASATWSKDWGVVGRMRVESLYDTYYAPPLFAGAGGDILVGDYYSHLVSYGADGRQRWAAKGAGSTYFFDTEDYFADAAVDADGSAWFLNGEEPNGALTRIAADGQVLWSRPMPGSAMARVTGGVVLVGEGWNNRTAIATKVGDDGGIVWQHWIPGDSYDVAVAPTGDGGVVVAQRRLSGETLLNRLDANGRVIRSNAPAFFLMDRPELKTSPSAIYLAGYSHVLAIDPASLARRWESESCTALGVVPAGAAGEGDALCLGDGTLSRLAGADGQVRWSVPLDLGDAARQLRMSANGLFVSGGGRLYSIDPAIGTTRWSVPVTNGETGSAVAGIGLPAGGRVGIAVADCVTDRAGCTVGFRQVAVDTGAVLNPVIVENATIDVAGRTLRDGDDVVSAIAVPGGERASVRVQVAAAADGVVRWDVTYPFDPYLYVYAASVAAAGDYIAVAVTVGATSNRSDPYPGNVGVIVFDRATGAVRWSAWYFGEGRYWYEPPGLAVDAQGQLVLGNAFFTSTSWGRERGSEILRLSAADGAVTWRVPGGFDQLPEVYRLGDDILAVYPDGVARVAAADGHSVWYAAGAGITYGKPFTLPGNDPVVFGNVRDLNMPSVSRLDYATGAEKWRRGYGDGVRRYMATLAQARAGTELLVTGGWFLLEQTPFRAVAVRKPYSLRLDAATGNVVAYRDRDIGTALGGFYNTSNLAADGRWWVSESRRFGNETGLASTWLTELDAAGLPIGSQALRITGFSDRERLAYAFPLEAPQANRLLVSVIARGGTLGDGMSTSMIDTTVAATGDLAVTLDAVPHLRPGKPFAYGATVTYTGSAPVAATLAVQLPWAEPGTVACTAPGGECTLDTRNGWVEARLHLSPGGSARLTGTLIARELDGTYGATLGGPMFTATVVGDTTLRETAIDNNQVFRQASMSLFANGFE